MKESDAALRSLAQEGLAYLNPNQPDYSEAVQRRRLSRALLSALDRLARAEARIAVLRAKISELASDERFRIWGSDYVAECLADDDRRAADDQE